MSMRSAARHGVNAALARLPLVPTSGRILLYHHVAPGSDPAMHVKPDLFRRQLEWLAAFGLRGTSVGSSVDARFPDGIVAVTFDDGYASAADACDVLAARGWRATLFVVPEWCETARPGILGWAALRELATSGFEVAAHGLDHVVLADTGAIAQLRRARETIEDHIGTRVRGLSYPHGIATRAARAAATAMYDYACTTEPRRNSSATPRMSLGRNEVMATDDTPALLRAKLGGSDDWMAVVRRFENGLRYGS